MVLSYGQIARARISMSHTVKTRLDGDGASKDARTNQRKRGRGHQDSK